MYIYKSPENIVQLSARMVGKQRWYTTPEGKVYPSITTILGIKEKPALIEWRKALGQQKADTETERAAKRGTAVHLMCERALQNEEDPTRDQPKDYIKLFNQLKFPLRKIDNIRMQEQALYSDVLEIAGRVDVIAEYDGVLSVIDFKTSNNNKSDEMVEDYFLQETFYALAYLELYGEAVEQVVTIMAVEKGGLPMVWKRAITPFISPLAQRIKEFYQSL
jgi:ATP-dependent exoDNAse (exonuclease V) beta subunit